MKTFPLAAIATCLGISGAAIGCSTQATQTSSSPLVELRPLSVASFNEAACPEFDENGDVGEGWLLTADAEEQCQLEGSGLSVALLTSHPGGAGKTLQEILDRCGGFINWCRGVKKTKTTAGPTPEPPTPRKPDTRAPADTPAEPNGPTAKNSGEDDVDDPWETDPGDTGTKDLEPELPKTKTTDNDPFHGKTCTEGSLSSGRYPGCRGKVVGSPCQTITGEGLCTPNPALSNGKDVTCFCISRYGI